MAAHLFGLPPLLAQAAPLDVSTPVALGVVVFALGVVAAVSVGLHRGTQAEAAVGELMKAHSEHLTKDSQVHAELSERLAKVEAERSHAAEAFSAIRSDIRDLKSSFEERQRDLHDRLNNLAVALLRNQVEARRQRREEEAA